MDVKWIGIFFVKFNIKHANFVTFKNGESLILYSNFVKFKNGEL